MSVYRLLCLARFAGGPLSARLPRRLLRPPARRSRLVVQRCSEGYLGSLHSCKFRGYCINVRHMKVQLVQALQPHLGSPSNILVLCHLRLAKLLGFVWIERHHCAGCCGSGAASPQRSFRLPPPPPPPPSPHTQAVQGDVATGIKQEQARREISGSQLSIWTCYEPVWQIH